VGAAAVVPTGGSSGVVGGSAVGRGPARRDPARASGPTQPRPEPVPRVGGDVGRMGRLRPPRLRLLRQGEALGIGRDRGPERGDQLRRLPRPHRAIHQGRRRRPVAVGVRRPHGRAVLPARRDDDPGRLPRRAREPDRQGGNRIRPGRRVERSRRLQRPHLQAGQSAARRREFGDDDGRPEPVAAAPTRAHDLAERDPGRQWRPAGGRSALGRGQELRAAGWSPTWGTRTGRSR
jgi:hypothetical protein